MWHETGDRGHLIRSQGLVGHSEFEVTELGVTELGVTYNLDMTQVV